MITNVVIIVVSMLSFGMAMLLLDKARWRFKKQVAYQTEDPPQMPLSDDEIYRRYYKVQNLCELIDELSREIGRDHRHRLVIQVMDVLDHRGFALYLAAQLELGTTGKRILP